MCERQLVASCLCMCRKLPPLRVVEEGGQLHGLGVVEVGGVGLAAAVFGRSFRKGALETDGEKGKGRQCLAGALVEHSVRVVCAQLWLCRVCGWEGRVSCRGGRDVCACAWCARWVGGDQARSS